MSEPDAIKVTEVIGELLPYAVVRIPIAGTFDQTVTAKPGQIRARVNDVTLTQSFRIQPLYWLVVLGALTLLSAIGIGIKLLQLFLWKTSKKH